jgi:hypothetical protein
MFSKTVLKKSRNSALNVSIVSRQFRMNAVLIRPAAHHHHAAARLATAMGPSTIASGQSRRVRKLD